MIYSAAHTTVYEYSSAASTSHNQVRLTPRRTACQTVHSVQLTVDPEPDSMGMFRDYYGNEVHHFSVLQAHDKLTISASSVVEVNSTLR